MVSSKNNLKNIALIGIFILTIFLGLNVILYGFTGKNYVSIIEKKILTAAGIYTEEIKSVEIKTNDWDSEGFGAWHIDKSAEWTSQSTAKVTFDLESSMTETERKKDVIFVFDISDTMSEYLGHSNSKLGQVKEDSLEVVDYLLSDEENSIALISFDTDSTIVTDFTKDKDTITNAINNLGIGGATNYNAALLNVLLVLNGYERKSNHDLVILFLTDGYPNTDCPNQIATYQMLKDMYPYSIVNGVQYEMGTDVAQDLVDISDNQYVADMDDLYNVLFDASISPDPYEEFVIEDYINNDYFEVGSVDDIEVSIGTVALNDDNGIQKVKWDLGSNYKIKQKASMTINLKLKDNYVETQGFYPTNKKEIITSKLADTAEVVINSPNTPVLKNYYTVTYDTNAPSGCSVDGNSIETYFVYQTVTKRTDELVCDGYAYKGWEIEDKNVKVINDDTFIMPAYDITIRGTWTRPSISKSMEGVVNEKTTLYKVVKRDALSGDGSAATYTGNGSDDYNYAVYYYQGAVTKNNVLFAGFCWQMVRTTDTGGVKMIYNGIPSSTGTCDNTGEDSQILSGSLFNNSNGSPAYVGYMYNSIYKYSTFSGKYYDIFKYLSMDSNSNYYFSTSYTYSAGTYTLVNSVQLGAWEGIYSSMAGKGYYTCKLTNTGTCSTLYYVIFGYSSYAAYVLELANGQSFDDVNTEMNIGTRYIVNSDGTYTLSGTITTIKKIDWYSNYSSYKNKYICSDYVSTTCSTLYYIDSALSYFMGFFSSDNNYKYGNDVEYDTSTGTYKLIDTDESSIMQFWKVPDYYNKINYNHYTCFNVSGECSSVKYIFQDNGSDELVYISLTGGKKIEDALVEMLSAEDVNKTDSTIKSAVDAWYKSNMTSYTDYLEDTVFCNDRSIYNLNGWDPHGGSITNRDLYFKSYNDKTDLTCTNKTDKFTVSDSKGNGKLTYPVGLITATEVYLAYQNGNYGTYYLKTGSNYWTMSPIFYEAWYASEYEVESTGGLSFNFVSYSTKGIRPVISLVPGTEYTDGDGSVDNPYVVETT